MNITLFDKWKTLKLSFFFVFFVVQCHGENIIPFRHDSSAIISIYEPLAPALKKKMIKKNKNFIDQYERTINRSKGIYKAIIPADIGVNEWNGFKYIYLIINHTNDVRLVLGNDDKKYMTAPKSQPGIMTDTTLFCGPQNAGICFYYQATHDELRAIISPLGLQQTINFKRLINFSIPDSFSNLSELPLEQNLPYNSITNFSWYLKNKKFLNDSVLFRSHNEKIQRAYGTYILDDKKFFNKLIFKDVDKWFLVIKSETEVYWIEEVNNQLFFVLDSRPGKIDEIFLTFGKSGDGTSLLYKANDKGISVVYNYAIGFYDDIDALENRFRELDEKELFQRKLFFKRTESIPLDSFPVRSRTPREAF